MDDASFSGHSLLIRAWADASRSHERRAPHKILPDSVSAAVLAGDIPPISKILMALLIGAMDAHAVVVGSLESSWSEKRVARLALAGAFLAAMAILGQGEA